MVGGSRGIVPVRALPQAAAFCRDSHRHLAIQGGQAAKMEQRETHSTGKQCRNGKNMMVSCIFQCKNSQKRENLFL